MGRGEVRVRTCLNKDAVAHASIGRPFFWIGGRKSGKRLDAVKRMIMETMGVWGWLAYEEERALDNT